MPVQSHLKHLQNEAIHILREVAGQFENPAILFSGGKDSITLAHLAHRAFWPGRSPLPWLHIDTGHNFPETLIYRDWLAEQLGARLIIRKVEDSIQAGRVQEETGPWASRNALHRSVNNFHLVAQVERGHGVRLQSARQRLPDGL